MLKWVSKGYCGEIIHMHHYKPLGLNYTYTADLLSTDWWRPPSPSSIHVVIEGVTPLQYSVWEVALRDTHIKILCAIFVPICCLVSRLGSITASH